MDNLQRSMALFGISLAGAAIALVAEAGLSGISDPVVTFRAVGPAGLHIDGKESQLEVGDDGQKVTLVVPVSGFETGIALRDRHMKEKYLETQKYPTATLSIPRASLRLPTSSDPVTADVGGTLTMHGQTKPVTVHYTAKPSGGKYQVDGGMRVNMNDFGIEVPVYLGISVKPDVNIGAQFTVGSR